MFFNGNKIWETYGFLTDTEGKNIETCGYMTNNNTPNQIKKCKQYEQKFEISQNPRELTPIVCGVAGHDGKPYCVYTPPYGSILWHTHPMGSKSYPSNSDIIKGLKPRGEKCQIIDSVLICEWGIWEWSAAKKENWKDDKLKATLTSSLDKIYFATNDGKGELTDKGRGVINTVINKLTDTLSGLEFQIYFTSWEEMKQQHFPYYYTLKIN